MSCSPEGRKMGLHYQFYRGFSQLLSLVTAALLLLAATACNSVTSASNQTTTSNQALPAVSLAISPEIVSATPGTKVQFAALVTNSSDTAVSWSASPGSISQNGLFVVPNASPGTTFQIKAVSKANPQAAASTTVAIAMSSSSSGSSSGTASPTGPDNRYCGTGDAPDFGPSDGPASTPAACYNTAQTSTPSNGNTTQVSPTGNLQTAINNAACGDVIVLQAGQTYPGFSLPAKNCDAGHYVTIRSSAWNSGLPAEGMRATPCNAGVASLPGRPALNCASTNKVMATIAGVAKQTGIITTATGANYYRLTGLEIADTGANGPVGGFYLLVYFSNADHIIVDRCWIHGSPTGEDIKGVDFSSSSYIAVIDSFISDIHSKISAYGADSSAIGSVTGPGPVKIVNNFLEAAGATILWGGDASTTNVSDVELRRNHLFKPFTWWELSPTYFGTLFAVKNLFENKTAVRELVEGNIFENNWAQSQKGTAILFYPKNQVGSCPTCTVHDVIFRYNVVRHAVNGLGISVTYATTCPGESGNGTGNCSYLSGPLYNMSLHDNLFDDINEHTYWPGDCCADGFMFVIGTDEPQNWPHDIWINNNTGFPVGSGSFNVETISAPQLFANFSYNNNLVATGDYGFHQVLPGHAQPGCGATSASGVVGVLNGCMGNSWQFAGNVLVNTSPKSTAPGNPLPPGNSAAANTDAVGFTNFNNGNGGNYQLLPTSPYKNAGTDGKDVGADFDALSAAIANVL
jgi:hypothetical protein